MDASIKIPCTLLPVNKHNLLLPNSAIAEVIVCGGLESPAKSPAWLIGSTTWQNQIIHIIAFDKFISSEKSTGSDKNTVVIVRNPSIDSIDNSPAFFGILVKNIPQVIEANSHNIDKNMHPNISHPHAKSYIIIKNLDAIIPDIASIAKAINNPDLA